jgi:hypothetical protein
MTMNADAVLRKNRGIERAWRQHDPRQGKIPRVAQRQLKLFKRGLARHTAEITRHLFADGGLPDSVVLDCIDRRGLARQQALRRARALLDGAVINGSRDMVEIRWLAAHDDPWIQDVREPGERQANITCHVALCWREGPVTQFWSSWLFECADHAAGRVCQLWPKGDLAAALFEAASEFTRADANALFAKYPDVMFLPGGSGAFVANLIVGKIGGKGQQIVYARARTWKAARMLSAAHKPSAAATKAAEDSIAALLLRFARAGEAVLSLLRNASAG